MTLAAKRWTFPAAQLPTARLAERGREPDAQLPARLALGDARPVARVGTTDTALMNFAQKDIEQTLDPDALQHETTLNKIWKRLEQDTKRH